VSSQMPSASVKPRGAGGSASSSNVLPKAKQSVAETSLPVRLLVELVSRILFLRGRLGLITISDEVKLLPSVLNELLSFMRTERLVEVNRRGATDADAEFQLTDAGRVRAVEAMERCQYAGPAPVSLAEYSATISQQSLAGLQFLAPDVRSALRHLVLPPGLVDQLGAAMNSGRSVLLYGPAGSGKTYLAERFSELLPGNVAVPYAITVGGEIIQVYDPLIHQKEWVNPTDTRTIVRSDHDERWVLCRRPVVITGGELSLAMLDLQFDPSTRFYQAPPHVKANGGLLIIDDLGRQLVEPRQLMNRWIVPLDRRRDHLGLQNGFKFEVPFELWVLFSTNLRPADLADEAFLRRFGYKVFVGPMTLSDYRSVFERVCSEMDIAFDQGAFDWLIDERHTKDQRALLACYPRDLIGRVRDFAVYEGVPGQMSPTTLARAWDTYFVGPEGGAVSGH